MGCEITNCTFNEATSVYIQEIKQNLEQLLESILGTGHDLSDVEVNTCSRILMNIRPVLYMYDLAKQEDGHWIYHKLPDGRILRMMRDLIFLMTFLSVRAGAKDSKIALGEDALDILREYELPETDRKVLDHRYETLRERK